MGYLPHILDDWFLVHNQICRHLTQTFFLFYLGSLFLIQQGYLPVSRLKEDHAKIAKILAEKEPFSPDQAEFLVSTVHNDLCQDGFGESEYFEQFQYKLEQYLTFLKEWQENFG